MILWPFFFFSVVFADELSVERYCFLTLSRMEKAAKQLTTITIPSDRVEKGDQCLSVTMRPHRRDLIQSFLRSIDKELSITFSSAEMAKDPCKLKIEKIADLETQHQEMTLENRPNAQITLTKSSGNETIQIQTVKNFEFISNQETVKGECRFIVPSRYEITLWTSHLHTQVTLTVGERIEVGSVIRALKESHHKAELTPSVTTSSTSEDKTHRIYLSINNN